MEQPGFQCLITVEGARIPCQELLMNVYLNMNAERPKKKETKPNVHARSEIHAVAASVGNLAMNPRLSTEAGPAAFRRRGCVFSLLTDTFDCFHLLRPGKRFICFGHFAAFKCVYIYNVSKLLLLF